MPVGNFRWGVYAFFDYDGEPIYVGQTNERIRTRIRRHLTNQRTDAVAMSVLDPFEVFEIEVWPLPHLQGSPRTDADARRQLDALERLITAQAIENSQFKAILNEKDPPTGSSLARGAAIISGADCFRACVRASVASRLPLGAARVDPLAPCAGDLGAEGPGWIATSASHPGKAAAMAGGAALRRARRRRFRCPRGGASLRDCRRLIFLASSRVPSFK